MSGNGEKKMEEIQKCDVCKKGYLEKRVYYSRSLFDKLTLEYIDCSNEDCNVHKSFEKKWKAFRDSQKEKRK